MRFIYEYVIRQSEEDFGLMENQEVMEFEKGCNFRNKVDQLFLYSSIVETMMEDEREAMN